MTAKAEIATPEVRPRRTHPFEHAIKITAKKITHAVADLFKPQDYESAVGFCSRFFTDGPNTPTGENK